MPAIHVEARRTLEGPERDAVLSLVTAATTADGARPLSDEQWLALTGPVARSDGAAEDRRPLILLARSDAPGGLAGLAMVTSGRGTRTLEMVVHPDRRDPAATLDRLLIEAAIEAVGREGGGRLRLWLPAPGPANREVAQRAGFAVERELHQLRVPLPLPAHPGTAGGEPLAIRSFVPGRDEAAWIEVNNRAFAGHPEQGDWRLADIVRREAEAWFDPVGFLLHEEGGRMAAFNWTKVHAETSPVMGEIYVIGVDPDFQGRGFGRALAVAGLAHLAGRGVGVGMLYVDGGNRAALGLYRSLGFTVDHTDVAYLREVPSRPQKPETPTSLPMP